MPPKKNQKIKVFGFSLVCARSAPLSLLTRFLHVGGPDHTALPRRELGAGVRGAGRAAGGGGFPAAGACETLEKAGARKLAGTRAGPRDIPPAALRWSLSGLNHDDAPAP